MTAIFVKKGMYLESTFFCVCVETLCNICEGMWEFFMLHSSNCSNRGKLPSKEGNFHQKSVPKYSWDELRLGALSNPHNANSAWGTVLLQSNRRWLQGDGSTLSMSCRIINLIDPSSLSILRSSELHSSIALTFLLGKADQAKEEKGALKTAAK